MLKIILYILMLVLAILGPTIIFNAIHGWLLIIGVPVIIWAFTFNSLLFPLEILLLISMINNRMNKDFWYLYYPILILSVYLLIANIEFLPWNDFFQNKLYNIDLRGKEKGFIWIQIYLSAFILGSALIAKIIRIISKLKNTN